MALEATDRLRAYLLPAVLLLIAVFGPSIPFPPPPAPDFWPIYHYSR